MVLIDLMTIALTKTVREEIIEKFWKTKKLNLIIIDSLLVFFPALVTRLFFHFETNIDNTKINSIVNYFILDLEKTETMVILMLCKYLFFLITIIILVLEFRGLPEKKVQYIYGNQKIKL